MSMNSDIHSNNSHSSNSYSSNHSSNNNLEGSPDHLVVLVHGVGGTACELKYIAKQLSKHKSLLLKAPEVNHGLTQDGIPQGANRIYHWILDIISSHSIKYLSFIGHSLGGIYARTVIGLLHKNHLIPNYIIPVNFITIATPHLGARQHAHLGSHITGRFLKTFFGDTLLQLTLTDSLTSPDQSFLLKLTGPFYITPLKLFTNLICYANVRYDSVVCYTTGNIRLSCITDDVLDKNQVSYPAVVEDKNDEHIQDVDLINDSLERKIHRVLNRLPWKRYAVFPSRPLIAHTDIIVRSESWDLKHGGPVVRHLVDEFKVEISEDVKQKLPDSKQLKQHGSDISHIIVVIGGPKTPSNFRDQVALLFKSPTFKVVSPAMLPNQGITENAISMLDWMKTYLGISKDVPPSQAKFSIVAHHLGGLYARCLVGLLYEEHLLPQILLPTTFITIDTPHIGKKLKYFQNEGIFELLSIDSTSFSDPHKLKFLLEPKYMISLKLFESLYIYYNSQKPSSIHSNSISLFNISKDYQSEVDEENLKVYSEILLERATSYTCNSQIMSLKSEVEMIDRLNLFDWVRYSIKSNVNYFVCHQAFLNHLQKIFLNK